MIQGFYSYGVEMDKEILTNGLCDLDLQSSDPQIKNDHYSTSADNNLTIMKEFSVIAWKRIKRFSINDCCDLDL